MKMLEGLHHHQSVLFSNIGQLLEKKRFLDVMLTCHNEAIMVHKLVLVAYSRYFDAVLLGHADRCPVINIDSTGIEFETLRAVISFMYKGIIDYVRERDINYFFNYFVFHQILNTNIF